jgi:hypothetical protein
VVVVIGRGGGEDGGKMRRRRRRRGGELDVVTAREGGSVVVDLDRCGLDNALPLPVRGVFLLL